jgi:ribosomal protein L37AE/L43A
MTKTKTLPAPAGLPLHPDHLAQLRASALPDDVIRERGYRSTDGKDLAGLGFSPGQRRGPGLLLPLCQTDGRQKIMVYRPDNPRVFEDKKGRRDEAGRYPVKVIKYEFPKGEAMRLDCPPRCQAMLDDPSVPLWITEGQKKADSLAAAGACAIALLGVWNFIGTNAKGGKVWLPDWQDIALNGRTVNIVFDSDVMKKAAVNLALETLIGRLKQKDAEVKTIYLSEVAEGKTGVDDYLATGKTLADLARLAEGPRPAPAAAPVRFTLLDEAPPTIERPLSLVNGQAFAVTWLHGQTVQTEERLKNGEVIRFATPKIIRQRRRFIVRQDGALFADDDIQAQDVTPLSKLGLDVRAADTQQDNRLWSKRGVTAYASGYRPNPAAVFGQVKDVILRFVDFTDSFTDPDGMGELMACYVLHTWFLDAFPAAGFLWVNGQAGSGKSTLMLVAAELGYLGQAVSPAGSFPSLRDLAHAGGMMGIDDAERLSDPKKTPPEIRELMLSGNRRGVRVPYKEVGPDGKWLQSWANAFCPRVFTAISRPDSVLSSRCIVIPLVKTDDARRGNADPFDQKQWPHDYDQLKDDLWALALANLADLARHVQAVQEAGVLVGRDLQPWLGMLAVGHWLDGAIPGLWARLQKMAGEIYQKERESLEVVSFDRVVLKAIAERAGREPDRIDWRMTSSELAEVTRRIAEENDLDMNLDSINARKVGRIVAQLRVGEALKGTRPRAWDVTQKALTRALRANRMIEAEKWPGHTPHGINGINGTNGAVSAINAIKQETPREEGQELPPRRKCPACKRSEWTKNAAGEWVCEVCHPTPANHKPAAARR